MGHTKLSLSEFTLIRSPYEVIIHASPEEHTATKGVLHGLCAMPGSVA